MKNLSIILLSLLILSCDNGQKENNISAEDLKYYTISTKKPGTLISKELESKGIVFLNYPDYVSESYSLIKFILAIMNKESKTKLYIPNMPKVEDDLFIVESLITESPLLGFEELIDLYNFSIDNNIEVTSEVNSEDDRILYLIPDSLKESISKELQAINNESVINVIMVGALESKPVIKVIEMLPTVKKISSVYKKDDKSVIYILNGEVNTHSEITPLKLYDDENYTNAPKVFIDKTKSIIPAFQITRMNNFLPKLIKKSFKNYGENR